MEKQKITIKDRKMNPQKVVYENHPFFNEIKNSLMPDDFREEMSKISNLSEADLEEIISTYYERIEVPYINDGVLKGILCPFYELEPVAIMKD